MFVLHILTSIKKEIRLIPAACESPCILIKFGCQTLEYIEKTNRDKREASMEKTEKDHR